MTPNQEPKDDELDYLRNAGAGKAEKRELLEDVLANVDHNERRYYKKQAQDAKAWFVRLVDEEVAKRYAFKEFKWFGDELKKKVMQS
jgi:hemerythrin superfamily protein